MKNNIDFSFIGNTTTGGGRYWYYPTDFPYDWDKQTAAPYVPTAYISYPDYRSDDLEKEIKKLKKKLKNKEIPMKSLFNVVVVSIDEKVLSDSKVIATGREEAMFNAGVHKTMETHNLKPKEVSILINDLGEVKVRPETKKVKVVKE